MKPRNISIAPIAAKVLLDSKLLLKVFLFPPQRNAV
jgi:hypothetical protein